jgi:hypothetical protein
LIAPHNAARLQRTLAQTYAAAKPTSPFSINETVSTPNAEKVVNPPKKTSEHQQTHLPIQKGVLLREPDEQSRYQAAQHVDREGVHWEFPADDITQGKGAT